MVAAQTAVVVEVIVPAVLRTVVPLVHQANTIFETITWSHRAVFRFRLLSISQAPRAAAGQNKQ